MALFSTLVPLKVSFFLSTNEPDFHKDSPLEILQYIYKCVPEAIKLLKLNSVISISSASVER